MKYKFLFTTAAVFSLIVMGGCKKFLDVSPQGQLTPEQALSDPGAARSLVTGVYNTLYYGGFGDNTVGFLYVMATDVASDDADKGSFDADFGPAKEIDNFTFTPTNFIFNNLWSGYYKGIVKANKAIDVINTSTFDVATKNRLIGEVRFIRGLYYFNLVRLFGGVPKIDRVYDVSEANSDSLFTRASKQAIYDLIISDLQFGVDNLPLKGDPATEVGRANKGAAEALLAKVYMYQKNWQKVFDLTKDIISSGKYSLVQDYNLIFREAGNNNSESIFEVQAGANANCDAVSELFSNGQGPRAGGPAGGGWNDLGFGLNSPSADLANAYEPGDTRKDASIIFIHPTVPGGPNPGTILWDGFRIPTKDSVENLRYSYKAYHSPTAESNNCSGNKDKKPKHIRILRYSEVLLMYAEAAANLGQAGEALDKLRMVRSRANLTTTSATIDDIWKERRVELALEQDRFFDLVRQGRAGTVLRAQGKAFVDNKNEVFPIPQTQIDLSGGRLTQNPNY